MISDEDGGTTRQQQLFQPKLNLRKPSLLSITVIPSCPRDNLLKTVIAFLVSPTVRPQSEDPKLHYQRRTLMMRPQGGGKII